MKKDFIKKVNELQTLIKTEKTGINKYQGFKYYTIEDIYRGIKKYLPDGLVVKTYIKPVQLGNRLAIECIAEITDGENKLTSNAFVFVDNQKKGMSAEQVMGSAITYARKYALSGLLLLDDGIEDPDNYSVEESKEEKKNQTEDLFKKFVEGYNKAKDKAKFKNDFAKKYKDQLDTEAISKIKKYIEETSK